MIRTCPKCGDYYADDLLAFCLADGTPLVNVAPNSERWSEGARIIEGKENALRKRKRKLKWRRFMLSATTMLIVTMVVCVVAINGFIYLKPRPEEVGLVKPLTPATAASEPGASVTPNEPGEPVPTPTPQPTPSPAASPTAAKITTPSPTPKPTPSPSPSFIPTPSPSPSPKPTPAPTPTPSPRPTPSPSPRPSPSPSPSPRPTPTPAPNCSDADKSREREAIIGRFGDRWRRNIEGERSKIIAQNAPAGVDGVDASLGPMEYQITFFKECMGGLVTARYAWQVTTNVQGARRTVTVAKQKRFACVKVGDAWLCR